MSYWRGRGIGNSSSPSTVPGYNPMTSTGGQRSGGTSYGIGAPPPPPPPPQHHHQQHQAPPAQVPSLMLLQPQPMLPHRQHYQPPPIGGGPAAAAFHQQQQYHQVAMLAAVGIGQRLQRLHPQQYTMPQAPQPLLHQLHPPGGGRVQKSSRRQQQQQQHQLQHNAGRILPLMGGLRTDNKKRKQQQQQHQGQKQQQRQQQQQQQQQQQSSQSQLAASSTARPVAEVLAAAQEVLREACADVDNRRDLPFQMVVSTIRERVPDFHFHYLYALARDLHSEALRCYYGNAAGDEASAAATDKEAASSHQLDDYTVLCDLYVCGVFSGAQGVGCNQLAARIDSGRRLIDLLLDAPHPLRVVEVQRPWQRGSNAALAVVSTAESDQKPDEASGGPKGHPPLLCLATGATNWHKFEPRAHSLSQCLVKFYGTDRTKFARHCGLEPPTSPLSVGAAWDPAWWGGGDSDATGVGVASSGLKSPVSPALTLDPWGLGQQLQLPRQLGHLFVCQPAPPVSKAMPPIAQFRLTCHFNGLGKVTSTTVGPSAPDPSRERHFVSVQLHYNGSLLSQADGPSLDAARTAAAVAFVESASPLQPVVRTQRTCSPGVPVVTRDALVARGRELYDAAPAKFNRAAQRLFQPNSVLPRAMWLHLVARQPELENFLLHCLAYVDTFHSEPLHCRVFGGDLEFPEMCALYSCLVSAGYAFQVDAVTEDWGSPCHQRLLVHRTADTAEIKRRLLTDGSFGRLELVSLGSRIDQVKAALGMGNA